MKELIFETAEVLKKGGVILYPTDTVWGLGCDATNVAAIKKIYQIKQRTESKSMIVLMDHIKMLHRYIVNIPEMAYDLIDFAEKPLTIIYDKSEKLPLEILNPEDQSIAVRICRDEFCQRLIYSFGRPLVSTSANISGEKTPLSFAEISDKIKNQVDFIVPYRQEEKSKNAPSTIIKLANNGQFHFIRK